MNFKRLALIAILTTAVVLCLAVPFAFAQVSPSSPPPPFDPNAILDAISSHRWVLLAALVVYSFTLLAKQGWLGTWMQSKLPARYIPFIAPALGMLGLTTSEIIAGIGWQKAFLDGAASGMFAVFGHQFVIESARGGRELIPEKTPASPPSPPSQRAMLDPKVDYTGLESLPKMPKVPSNLTRAVQAFAVCLVVSTVSLATGCAAWWQEIKTNPQAAVAQLLQYVSTFISGAQAVWSIVLPLLAPSVQSKANVDFSMAVTTLSSASAALQDAVKAAAAAQQPNPDFGALIADVQAAVAQVMSVVQMYTSHGDAGATVAGAPHDATAHLEHQAQVIATWR